MHSVSQGPNLRQLSEPLGGAESLLEAVSFKKVTEGMGRGRVANARWKRVPHSGAATLKPWEPKVVRTQGTDSRLLFADRRERAGVW